MLTVKLTWNTSSLFWISYYCTTEGMIILTETFRFEFTKYVIIMLAKEWCILSEVSLLRLWLLIFRVVKLDKGNFRTVSSNFLKQVEEQLQENNLNEKYGWIFWETCCWKILENILTVESPCGIEPQSLINENLTIRLWRFAPTAAVSSFLSWKI